MTTDFLDQNDSSMARQELEKLALDIGVLNDQKRGWQKAWEGEVARTGDQTLEKPPELRAINKQLGPLYGRREDLLRRFPHLEAEYGGKKRTPPPVRTVTDSAARQERAARKKANHERNLARRREEDRARAHGGKGGGGGGAKQAR